MHTIRVRSVERIEREYAVRVANPATASLYTHNTLDRSAADSTILLRAVHADVSELRSQWADLNDNYIHLRKSVHGLVEPVRNPPEPPAADDDAVADGAVDAPAPIGCETAVGGRNRSAVYRIRASAAYADAFYAFCEPDVTDRTTPAWTVILSRTSADTNFVRSWAEYRNGFGNVAHDHWIGLDVLNAVSGVVVSGSRWSDSIR